MKIRDIVHEQKKPNLDEAILDLLGSIAKEESALSKLVSSEARKVNAFIGEDDSFPTCANSNDIVTFSRTVNSLIDSVLMKEWLLLKKLETVISIKDRMDTNKDKKEQQLYWDDDLEDQEE